MKKYLIIILFILIGSLLFSENSTIQIKAIPKSVDEFLAMRDEISKTPEGGASLMIVALLLYAQNEELGKQCLVIAVSMDRLIEGDAYKGFKLMNHDMDLIKLQLGKQKYIPKSYFKSTSSENDYEIGKTDLSIEYKSTQYSGDKASGTFKLFVYCSGADTPRPITLKVNDKGIWKAEEWSSLIVGIKKAKSEIKKDDI
jgi:hypothetical protein